VRAGSAHLAMPFLERMCASDDWDDDHPSDLWLEAAVLVGSQQYMVRGQALLEQTVDLSSDKGIKLLELRAATMLAPLLRAGGDSERAQHLLGRVYEEITEGRDTYPLQQAAATLKLLSDVR
jgi:hypothetical protein